MMDYEVQRCTRHCAITGRELTPGELVYSALLTEGKELVRKDFAADAWQGPPEGAIGWWQSRIPAPDSAKRRWAPNDVMLQLFEELEQQPARQDMRYVLALLLVRRRVMRVEEEERPPEGQEMLVLYCPRREATYHVPVVMPDETRIQEIQDELSRLLFANAA